MKNNKQQDQYSIQNIIAKGTKIVGDFFSEGDLRIDGTIEGNIKTPGKVVVGKDGEVIGKLKCSNAYFEGKLIGTLELTETLTLKESAHIEGDVVTQKLAVEPGATFNVTCVMKTSVKELNGNSKPKKQLNNYARYSGLVIQMVAIIVIGAFAGVKLDEKYPNKNNLFTLTLTLFSVIVSIYYVIRRIISVSKDDK